jgi:Lectin C-type domain
VLRLPALAALLVLSTAGCSFSVDYSGSHFACADGKCPDGFECRIGLCEPNPPDGGADPSDGGPDAPPGTPDGAPDAPGPQCDGFDQVLDPVSGHCYTFDRTPRIWIDAAVACNGLGPTSHLVFITSSAENVVVSLLGDNGSSQLTWIGGTDGPTEGDWRWLDGSDFPPSPTPNVYSFSHWNSGEPNNGNTSGEENCAAIQLGSTSHGFWDDRVCDVTRGSICETE